MKTHHSLLALLLVACSFPFAAKAQLAGDLDTSFNPGTGGDSRVFAIVRQPDGKLVVGGQFYTFNGFARNRIVRLNEDGSTDTTFVPGFGADSTINGVALAPDGRVVVGGDFLSFNGLTRYRVARLNADGSLDSTFLPALGTDGSVQAVAVQPDGKVLVAGGFSSANGVARSRVARFNVDGSLDTSFDPGTGANGYCLGLVLQPDGKILLGGYFSAVNGVTRHRIARLNSDGSVDTSFTPGTLDNGYINGISLAPGGKILVAGGLYVGSNVRVLRLNADGTLDTGFNVGLGINSDAMSAIAQGDGKVLIGGYFTTINGLARNGVARLNADGSLDTAFDPGAGANHIVWTLLLQPDGLLVAGGSFTTYQGASRNFITRIHNSSVNQAPVMGAIASLTILEDSGLTTVTVTGIAPGPVSEIAQTVTNVTATSSDPGLVPHPAVTYTPGATTATLNFTPVANSNGNVTISVVAEDNGGTASGGVNLTTNTFTITVAPVNDAPSFALPAGTTSANLLVNGSFETGDFTGWVHGAGAGDTVTVNAVATDGTRVLFLNAADQTPNGTLSQLFATVPGQTYTLTFDYGTFYGNFGNPPQRVNVQVSNSDLAPQQAVTPSNGVASVVSSYSYSFVASGTSSTLTFSDDAGNVTVSADGILDNVRVTTVNPLVITVLEDAGPQTSAAFATSILAGPANESAQVLSFIVTNNNPARFDVQPAIDASGTLTFTPGTNRNGSAVVTVYLQDNGGILNGGVDLAGPLTFTITLTPVNDPPTITFATNDVVVLEDSGAFSGSLATFATPPSNEGSQSVTNVVTSNSSSNLFSVQPSVSTGGVLTFTPAANSNGVATVTVIAQDNGGTANGGVNLATNTFTITVTAVNDAPSFAIPPGTTTLAGETWTARESVRGWRQVASSDDGSKLVALDYPSGKIYTSTDSGVSWTARESNRAWLGVASSADGSKLVAVDNSPGQIYTSTDGGTNWTARESSRNWYRVASSADGTKLVATVYGGQIYTSADSGVSWTPRESSRSWLAVASSADGSKLIATEYGGQLYTSTDSGLSWMARESSRNWYAVASSADGSKLVAVVNGSGQIYTSTDSGTNWVARESNRSWTGVASSADGTRLVATMDPGQIYTSVDSGVSWTARETSRSWSGIASSADGKKLVASVSGGQIYTSVEVTLPYTVTVAEDSGAYTQSSLATSILAGPADESAQVVSFVVTNDNNALFSSQPAISTAGTLTFTPALNANGSATVTVYAQDNGGILNGGVDTAGPQTFTITVTAVNDAPSFTKGPDQLVYPGDGPVSVANWATNISVGPADELAQTLTFTLTNGNNALFTAQPALSPSGTLTCTPVPGAVGVVTVGVSAQDTGGTANGGVDTSAVQTFTITLASGKVFVSSSPSVLPGETVNVPVSLAAAGMENGVGFTLTFDPTLLTFTSVVADSGLTLVANSGSAAAGQLGLLASRAIGTAFPAGTNLLLTVTFTAAPGAPVTNTPIGFSSAVATRQVTEADADVIPFILYTGGSVSILALPASVEGDVTPRPTGNGTVTITDAVQIGNFAAGLATITNFGAGGEFQRADCAPLAVKGDGYVTVADWVQALRFAAALDLPGTPGGPTMTPVALRPAAVLPADGRTIRVTGGNLVAGRANTVSVQLDAQGNESGVQFTLGFDPAVLTFVSATTGTGAPGGSVVPNAQRASVGRLGLLLVMPAGNSIAAGTRDIITLTFNVTGTGGTAVTVLGHTLATPQEVADVNANPVGATYVGASFNLILPAGLKAAGLERAPNGSLRLVVRNTDGTPITAAQAARYAVHVTSNLGGAWTLLPNALVLEGGALKIVDPVASAAGLRLYKLVESP